MQYIDNRDYNKYFKEVAAYEKQEADWKKQYITNVRNTVINCECGLSVKKPGLTKHRKTNLHLTRMKIANLL